MNPIFLLLFFSLLSLPPFSSSHGFHFPSLLKPSQISKTHNSDQKSSHGYETKHFTQILDHFNYQPESYISFQQRYLVNGDYWGGEAKSSPIFVYAGNEGSIDILADNNGFLLDIAPTFEALIVFIEHRYYGKSFPFGSEEEAFRNATTAGYLSISQALADYAAFVVELKKNLSAESSPVVVFGGSYGGMLAAWFRLKYPHLAIGALASSAPILQIDPTFDPYIFNDIVTKDYRSASENCYKVIKNSWNEIDKAYNDSIKLEKMESSLRLCKGQGLYTQYWLSNALIYAAMTDYPTPSYLLQPLPAFPVNEMCKAIDNPNTGNDTFSKLYGAMNIYYNFTGTAGECFNVSAAGTNRLGYSGWSWQTCTEFDLPTAGNSKESIFPESKPTSIQDMTNLCKSHEHVEPRFSWPSIEFGASIIKKSLKRFGSNIIFFNGLRDPWSGGGILKSISSTVIAIVAAEGAHHVDLRGSTMEDPKWLLDVREREVQIIKQWIREYYEDFSISENI
ncbi:hypothetical protein M5K25_021450 [Dendrobium thyrsiflorum]|uniref:Lysosomal Pro-X carboxypeptidase n=1 Tax=Dendrobium thyrsiflorum TaxID=117978 RepID=A0ABD0UCF7_DENTH